jgi:transcriptional regulator with XRE-family HTH domain
MNAFAKFLIINGLKRKEVASFLGVSGAFITQISSGDRPLPEEKLAAIKANAYGWDTSMFDDKTLSGLDRIRSTHKLSSETIQSTIEEIMNPEERFLIGYLERKIEDKDRLIQELYKEIGSLKAKLDLAMNGDVTGVITSIFPKEKA